MTHDTAANFDWNKVHALTHRQFPDEIARLSERQRARRLTCHADLITLEPMHPALRQKPRVFFRVIVGIPIPGPPGDLKFEAWIEVTSLRALEPLIKSRDAGTFDKILHGKLANEIPSYPGSLALAGRCQFRDKDQVPYFTIEDDHQLATDQRTGFTEPQLLEWLIVNAGAAQQQEMS